MDEGGATRTPTQLRLVIVDDEPLFREGVKLALAPEGDVVVVGEASAAGEALDLLARETPDVAVIDLGLPGTDGIHLIREISDRGIPVRLLMMTVHDRERDVVDALAAGALGYVLKADPLEVFLAAVRAVARGERFVSPSLPLDVVAPPMRGGDARGDVLAVLSAREREVFALIVRGATNEHIAHRLGLSVKTVDTHRSRINEKLSCGSASDLVRFAVLNGLIAARDAAPNQ